ncbi:unnamed protein product [Meloidogyne enterolobii]|uniref:Uncharacterized protein n=1 Tax=Meloidogyne enterolobii TaxID=390850 RepID=A0ACB0ZMK5_MELEN
MLAFLLLLAFPSGSATSALFFCATTFPLSTFASAHLPNWYSLLQHFLLVCD